MASTIVTKTISSLDAVTSPADTDLLPVGTSSGATLKKLTIANLKSKIATVESTYDSTLSNNLACDVSFAAKRVNGLVFGHIQVHTKTQALTAWQSYTLCNAGAIPEKLRPSESLAIYTAHQQGSSGSMVLGTDGSIKYTPWNGAAQNTLIGVNFTYIGK